MPTRDKIPEKDIRPAKGRTSILECSRVTHPIIPSTIGLPSKVLGKILLWTGGMSEGS